MGIIGRITSNLKLMLQRPPRQQFAAICHRTKKKTGELEVLLITSRDTGRWVIPKGWHMEGKQPHAIAEQEAYEEAGIKGIALDSWAAVLAPAGTPPAIVRRMSEEVTRIVRSEEMRPRLEAMGTFPGGGTPEEFDAFVAAETSKWGKVIREAGVTPD